MSPDLREIARALRARASGRIALDTEFMGEGRYRTLLCLIQLAVPDGDAADERIVLVDPLAEDLDCGAAGGRARRPRHPGGRARRAPGHRADPPPPAERGARRLRHAGRGGLCRAARPGLIRHAAGASVLGVRVAKSASFTRWDARPLSAEQLAYAREDVVHLLELAAELERRLTELGRLEWAREECEPLQDSSDERDLESDVRAAARAYVISTPPRSGRARAACAGASTSHRAQDRPVQSVLRTRR